MTVKELIEKLKEYPSGYEVMLETDNYIDTCIKFYSNKSDTIIIGLQDDR